MSESDLSAEIYAVTLLPAPSDLVLDSKSTSEINFSWTNNDNSTGGGIRTEVSADGGSTWSTINNDLAASTTSETYSNVSAGEAYTFRVTRYTDHDTTTSGTLTVQTLSAPSNLTLNPSAEGELTASWTAASGAEKYTIYRSQSSGSIGSDYTSVTTIDASSTSYTDTGLEDGEKYFYQITSVANGSESDTTSEQSATTPLPAPNFNSTDAAAVSRYPLNSVSDGTAEDVWNGENGSISGSTTSRTGRTDTAWDVSGRNDSYIPVTDAVTTPLDGSDGWAISYFVYHETLDEYGVDFGTGTYWIESYRDSDRGVSIKVPTSSGELKLQSDVYVTTGQWEHIVATYDGTDVVIYYNGTEALRSNQPDTIFTFSDYNWTLGNYGVGGSNGRAEAFDEFRFYSRGLSQSEVNTLTNDPTTGLKDPVTVEQQQITVGTVSNSLGSYPIDSLSDNTLADTSGNSRDGTPDANATITDGWAQFNGNSDEDYEIPASANPNWWDGDNLTYGVLFRTTDAGVIYSSSGGGHVPAISIGNDGYIGISLHWHGDTSFTESTSGGYNDGTAHTIIGTFENGTETLYIDGSQVAQRTGLSQDDYNSGDYTYTIGSDPNGSWNALPGGVPQEFTGEVGAFVSIAGAINGDTVTDVDKTLQGVNETVVSLSWNKNDNSTDGGIDVERQEAFVAGSFDDGTLNEWTGFAPTTTQAYDGEYSATSDGSNGNQFDSQTFAVPSGTFESRVWVYIPSGQRDGQHITGFESGSDWCGPHVRVRNGGNIDYYDGSWNGTGQVAPVDTWFRVRAVIDIPDQTFDYYYKTDGGDETQILTAADFITRASFVAGDERFLRITDKNNNNVFYDNISIGKGFAAVETGLSSSTTSYTDTTSALGSTYQYLIERNTDHATATSTASTVKIPLGTIDGNEFYAVTIDGSKPTGLTIDGTTIYE